MMLSGKTMFYFVFLVCVLETALGSIEDYKEKVQKILTTLPSSVDIQAEGFDYERPQLWDYWYLCVSDVKLTGLNKGKVSKIADRELPGGVKVFESFYRFEKLSLIFGKVRQQGKLEGVMGPFLNKEMTLDSDMKFRSFLYFTETSCQIELTSDHYWIFSESYRVGKEPALPANYPELLTILVDNHIKKISPFFYKTVVDALKKGLPECTVTWLMEEAANKRWNGLPKVPDIAKDNKFTANQCNK